MKHKTFLIFLIFLECLKICFSKKAPLTTSQCEISQFRYSYDTKNFNFLWKTTGDNCANKNFTLVIRNSTTNCKNEGFIFIKNLRMSVKNFSHPIHLDRCGFYEYFIRQNSVVSFETKLIFNGSTDFKVTNSSDSNAEVSWQHSDFCCLKKYNLLVSRKFDNGIILNETVEGTKFTVTNLSLCWNYGITVELAQLAGNGQINQFEQTFKLQEKPNKDFSLSSKQGLLNIRINPRIKKPFSYLIEWKSENLLDSNEVETSNESSFIQTMYSCMTYAVAIYVNNEKDKNRIFEGCVKSQPKGISLKFEYLRNTHNYYFQSLLHQRQT